MTIQEIKMYLQQHTFLVFCYRSEFYTLERRQSLFGFRYRFVTTNAMPQQRNSLEELCEQVCVDGTLLMNVIQQAAIPEWSDPVWETYEAVRHNATVHGREIHFSYRGRDYWISHTKEGRSYLSDDFDNTQAFGSCRELFENARINGNTLKDIWGETIVDAC